MSPRTLEHTWKKIEDTPAPEGTEVYTKIEDEKDTRNEQPLRVKPEVAFSADMSMYVYYRPND